MLLESEFLTLFRKVRFMILMQCIRLIAANHLDTLSKLKALEVLKQPLQNIENFKREFYASMLYDDLVNGAIFVEKEKVVICSYPKSGSTLAKWVILSILYNESFCTKRYYLSGNQSITTANDWRRFTHHRLQMYYNQGLKQVLYFPPPTNESVLDWNIGRMFLDPKWLTVAFVRDPWERSISIYYDQKRRGYKVPPSFRDFFADWPGNVTSDTYGSHKAPATNYCGLKHLDYDLYIDMDKIEEGLTRLIQMRPHFAPLLTKGWANCTEEKTDSLLKSKADVGHQVKHLGHSTQKKRNYDRQFCNRSAVDFIYNYYQEDYEVFHRKEIYSNHTCLQ